MRALTIIVAVAAVVECSPALAQTTTPNVVTPAPGPTSGTLALFPQLVNSLFRDQMTDANLHQY
jgi:hypothetical protein